MSHCLLCVLSRSSSKVPRLLAITLHASRPNEVLHFDYLYIGEGENDKRYALAVKDDFSGYTWLRATTSASALNAPEGLSRLQRTFTAPLYWVSDQGAQLFNASLESMARDFNIQQKPTVAYFPWVNGTVERLNRDILAAMQAMPGELNMAPQEWASVIDLIPSILNEAPEERLGRNADGSTWSALQDITGILPGRALLQVM